MGPFRHLVQLSLVFPYVRQMPLKTKTLAVVYSIPTIPTIVPAPKLCYNSNSPQFQAFLAYHIPPQGHQQECPRRYFPTFTPLIASHEIIYPSFFTLRYVYGNSNPHIKPKRCRPLREPWAVTTRLNMDSTYRELSKNTISAPVFATDFRRAFFGNPSLWNRWLWKTCCILWSRFCLWMPGGCWGAEMRIGKRKTSGHGLELMGNLYLEKIFCCLNSIVNFQSFNHSTSHVY